jgi:hypothetical protein
MPSEFWRPTRSPRRGPCSRGRNTPRAVSANGPSSTSGLPPSMRTVVAVAVGCNRARLAKGHVAVPHDRDLAKGMDGVDLGSVRHGRNKGVGDTLLGAGDARDPHVIALWSADDLKLRHGCAPSSSDRPTTRRRARKVESTARSIFSRMSEYSASGSPAADRPLANPVRSGRKQP